MEICGCHLSHDHVLALFNEFPFCLDNCLEKLDVLDISTVGLYAVDEVLDHSLVDLTAQLEVVHEDVLHGHCLQDLGRNEDCTQGWGQKEPRAG